MFDAINVAGTGLMAASKTLSTIGNNVSNLNSMGFKLSQSYQTNLGYRDSLLGGGAYYQGNGVNTPQSTLSFKSGELRETGNELDFAIDGKGFFVVQNEKAERLFSRSGSFELVDDQVKTKQSGMDVLYYDQAGRLSPLDLSLYSQNPAKATTKIELQGVLVSPTSGTKEVSSNAVSYYDANGEQKNLYIRFSWDSSSSRWRYYILSSASESTPTNSDGELSFTAAGSVQPTSQSITFGGQVMTLNFASMSGAATTGADSVSLKTQDGYSVGKRNAIKVAADGTISIDYTNQQKKDIGWLALAEIARTDFLRPVNSGLYEYLGSNDTVQLSKPKQSVLGGVKQLYLEASNVDLSREFSELVIAQRSYQAASQVMTTASEMIQQLFELRKR